MQQWQIQEAKQHLSEVLRNAETEGPQLITYRGEPKAWIISDKEYTELTKQKESIVDFFQRSPHRDVQLQAERKKDRPRKVDL